MDSSIAVYRKANLGTASPRHILIKTLDAGVRFVAQAEASVASGQDPGESLIKARTIVGGLMAALNFEAGDLAKQLLQLYLFVLDRIQSTSAAGEDEGLGEARRVLETLRSAWEEMPAEDARRDVKSRRPSGLSLKG